MAFKPSKIVQILISLPFEPPPINVLLLNYNYLEKIQFTNSISFLTIKKPDNLGCLAFLY